MELISSMSHSVPGKTLLSIEKMGVYVQILFFLSTSAAAQEPPDLITDRPTQSESSSIMEKGYILLETGWVFAKDEPNVISSDEMRVYQFPTTLFRIGFRPKLEIRLGIVGWQWLDIGGDRTSGFNDIWIGAKVYLFEEDGWLPESALSASLSIPVGDIGFSSERFVPSFRGIFTHSFFDRFSLVYNLGLSWMTEEVDGNEFNTTVLGLYTATLGASLTSQVGVYAELFGFLDRERSPANSFNGGLTFLLSRNIQLDLEAGFGLSNAAEDFFIGAGAAWRLPR